MKHLIWCSLFLCGCAHMSVEVQIFDRMGTSHADAIEASASLEAARIEANQRRGLYGKLREDLKVIFARFMTKMVSEEVVAENRKQVQLGKYESAVDDQFLEIERLLAQGQRTAREASREPPGDRRLELFREALSQLAAGEGLMIDFMDTLSEEVDGVAKQRIEELGAQRMATALRAASDAKEESSGKIQSILGEYDLFDDPLAPVVIAAPDRYWRGTYNRAWGYGFFGNTDIAIKMDRRGSFTLKGLRLDASKMTEATFQVIKGSVRLVAAAYGVPLLQASGDAGGVPGAQAAPATDQLAGLEGRRQRARVEQTKARFAVVTILGAILSEREALKSETPEVRKGAVQRIKGTFTSYKPFLVGHEKEEAP